jgi:hypothetical protein
MCGSSVSLQNYHKHLAKECQAGLKNKIVFPNFDMMSIEPNLHFSIEDYMKLYLLRQNLIKNGEENVSCYEDDKTAKFNLGIQDLEK